MRGVTKQTTLVVLQPGYLPWLGFFDQMQRCDIFVLYDDVAFDKHGWRNRNRIKSPNGPLWLTVPVHVDFLGQKIMDVQIDNSKPWAKKQLSSIKQLYAAAPYLKSYYQDLSNILEQGWDNIVDLDIALVNQFCAWLGIERRIVRSSELEIGGERSERLANLCSHFGANHYLSGTAAKSYLNLDLFRDRDIEVSWQEYEHPVYPQLHGEFVPYLSIVDLLLNCGDQSAEIIANAAALSGSHQS